ncbi:MAG: ABC transporter substrate-binding protein [Actinomycetota bacterium]|nr:ABC transporter substrate-binding protein [Actinomycetota bacterium]
MLSSRGKRRWSRIAALAIAPALVLGACGGDDESSSSSDKTPVRLQLQWFAQSQFAGYYVALDKGFYAEEGLDVSILEGAVDIVPQQVLGSGQAEFAISWVPKSLASREQGIAITDIGQVFQRSGTLQVSWKDSGPATVADLAGTKIGNWGFGNEFEVLAGLRQAGLDPEQDVELIQQNFDMQALLNREIDSAQAMIYNEFGILLQTENPETGDLYSKDLFNVINWNDEGTAMLQDAIWAGTDWLKDEKNQETAVKFLKASYKGWAYCRDNVAECAEIVVKYGSALNKVHMEYMMNEVNALIWPSPQGIGIVDSALWEQTVSIATDSALITKDPGADVYRNDLSEKAIAELEEDGIDVKGSSYSKPEFDIKAAIGG